MAYTDINIENGVIGAMLIDPECISKVIDAINENHLEGANTKECFKIIADEYRRNGDIDILLVLNRLEKNPELKRYAAGCMEITPTSANVELYCDCLKARDAAKKAAQLAENAGAAALEGKGSGAIYSMFQEFADSFNDSVVKSRALKSGAELAVSLLTEVGRQKEAPYISTGFKSIDEAIGGGLHYGIHIMGAMSGTGKTALALQMADNIAGAGRDVLFFSLEMPPTDLVARSLARLTYCLGSGTTAKTTREITIYSEWEKSTEEENKLRNNAAVAYGEFAKSLFIIGRNDILCVDDIKRITKRHMKKSGKKPLVIIDYLQAIPPEDPRATDKQNIDIIMRKLQTWAGEEKIPVFALSSINRASYNEKGGKNGAGALTLSALKESGGIEYDADYVYFLEVVGREDGEKEGVYKLYRQQTKEERATPKRIAFEVAKNREGATGIKVELDYYPAYHYFTDETPF